MREPTKSVAAKFRSLSPEGKDGGAPRSVASKDAPSELMNGGSRRAAVGSSSAGSANSKAPSKGCWASAGFTMDNVDPLSKFASSIQGGGGAWKGFQSAAQHQQEQQIMKETLTFDALFKRYELNRAFSLDSDQVRKDAKRVKQRLYQANRFLLDPESRGMQTWDLSTIVALLFTLLVSPYEIGFLDKYTGTGATFLFWINQTVTLIFATDMVLNFFRPYRDQFQQKVKSHRLIALNYAKSWLVVDIVSTVPFDIISLVLSGDGTDGTVGAPRQGNMGLKVIRLLRLLKLFRIVRASRVFARWSDRIEHYVSISHSSRTLLWWMFMLIVTVHWFCCAWGLTAQLHGSQRTPELELIVAADPTCEPFQCDFPQASQIGQPVCSTECLSECERKHLSRMYGWNDEITYNNENWICRAIHSGHIPGDAREHLYRYTYVISGSSTNIVGQISPQNMVEYCFAYILAFCWMMMMNSFIGILCGTIADGDRHAKEYKQRMDELNYFLRDMQAPRELAVRAREHCRATRDLFKKKEYQKLFHNMSPSLRGDLAQQMSLRTLENVWYFGACEAELLRSLSEKLKPIGFARGEKIYYEERINIVAKGAAARGGKILTVDCYWGEDMIITSAALKDTRYASALTYVELTTVLRDDLEDSLVHFPNSERKIRVTALKMAMQRAGQIIAHHLQTRNKAKMLSGALSKIDPSNKTYAAHAAERSNEQILKEMMMLVNGGKKLRTFDAPIGEIVDESSMIIDNNYVREHQQKSRLPTDKALIDLRERLEELQSKQDAMLSAEREAMEAERRAMASEREAFRTILGHDLKIRAKGSGAHSESLRTEPTSPKPVSPTGTLTDRIEASAPTRLSNGQKASSASFNGSAKQSSVRGQTLPPAPASAGGEIRWEKRYRRRKKTTGTGGSTTASPTLNATSDSALRQSKSASKQESSPELSA